MNHGTTLASDYRTYQANEESCTYQTSQGTKGQILSRHSVGRNAQDHLDALQSRPLTISYASGSGDDFYSGGIIYSENYQCANDVNHAVSLVGYHSSTAGTSDDPDCDPNGTTTECTTEEVQTSHET